jgi:hypothetical protein
MTHAGELCFGIDSMLGCCAEDGVLAAWAGTQWEVPQIGDVTGRTGRTPREPHGIKIQLIQNSRPHSLLRLPFPCSHPFSPRKEKVRFSRRESLPGRTLARHVSVPCSRTSPSGFCLAPCALCPKCARARPPSLKICTHRRRTLLLPQPPSTGTNKSLIQSLGPSQADRRFSQSGLEQ